MHSTAGNAGRTATTSHRKNSTTPSKCSRPPAPANRESDTTLGHQMIHDAGLIHDSGLTAARPSRTPVEPVTSTGPWSRTLIHRRQLIERALACQVAASRRRPPIRSYTATIFRRSDRRLWERTHVPIAGSARDDTLRGRRSVLPECSSPQRSMSRSWVRPHRGPFWMWTPWWRRDAACGCHASLIHTPSTPVAHLAPGTHAREHADAAPSPSTPSCERRQVVHDRRGDSVPRCQRLVHAKKQASTLTARLARLPHKFPAALTGPDSGTQGDPAEVLRCLFQSGRHRGPSC